MNNPPVMDEDDARYAAVTELRRKLDAEVALRIGASAREVRLRHLLHVVRDTFRNRHADQCGCDQCELLHALREELLR